MENKEIIINGVDVNGCLFYQTNFEENYDVKIKHYCSNWHNSCESNNNSSCYYKQLKRKEQECEELRKQVKELRQGWVNCDKERNLQEANSEFNQRVINRYKQTLTEIKEIAEICSFTDSSELLLKRIKQILLEISEVEK